VNVSSGVSVVEGFVRSGVWVLVLVKVYVMMGVLLQVAEIVGDSVGTVVLVSVGKAVWVFVTV
jgi:hypothetical protein